jgi:integrase
VKTFVLDAQKNGQEISSQMRDFKGYSLKVEKIILSFEELEILRLTKFENRTLESAKDWLIIGCFTGQRVSDLLRMTQKMIHSTKGFDLIQITQQKTGKTVQIPIHPIVRETLNKRNGRFPETLGNTPDSVSAMFNRSIKEVCRLVGFNSIEKGTSYDFDKKQNVEGEYEKWRLVTSHICRRSFATNFYADQKYPTPILMNITAHSTEKQFLEYIGKPPLDYSLQLAETWSKEELVSVNEPRMTVVSSIKKAS